MEKGPGPAQQDFTDSWQVTLMCCAFEVRLFISVCLSLPISLLVPAMQQRARSPLIITSLRESERSKI